MNIAKYFPNYPYCSITYELCFPLPPYYLLLPAGYVDEPAFCYFNAIIKGMETITAMTRSIFFKMLIHFYF